MAIKRNPLEWLVEELEEHPSFINKPMFGCRAIYLHGELKLVLAAQGEPWQGVLVATDQSRQPGLLASFSGMQVHPILKKWLYLPEEQEDFERQALRLVQLTHKNDPQIGVLPSPHKRKSGKKRPR